MSNEPIPVDLAWPGHAGHEILYSEHGRTDYILKTVTFAVTDSDVWPDLYEVAEYDNRPTNGKIHDTEVWCSTCGVQLEMEKPDVG